MENAHKQRHHYGDDLNQGVKKNPLKKFIWIRVWKRTHLLSLVDIRHVDLYRLLTVEHLDFFIMYNDYSQLILFDFIWFYDNVKIVYNTFFIASVYS